MKAVENVSALGAALLRMVESRLELFGLELRQERARVIWVLGLVFLACGSFLLTGVGVFVLLAIALPPHDRVAVLALCVCALGLVCVVSTVFILRILLEAEMPFQDTREELRKDAQCLVSVLKKDK